MANKNYDETVNLAQGGDTGYDETASVQPIAPGESVWDSTTDRPIENLRKRTETLRQSLQDLLYYADYDRCWLIRSDAVFTFTTVSGTSTLAFTGDDLWLYPALTPGRNSGGRLYGGQVFSTNGGAWLPYSGTLGVNDLSLVASSKSTGQRGYADGETFDGGGNNALSLGANGIQVNLVASSGLTGNNFTVVITGTPKRVITITYGTGGTPTTLTQLITFINGDTTSQGTYGVANYLHASTTGTGSNQPTPFTGGLVQGAYDAEAHQVTTAQMAAFFAISTNALAEGESLALAYPAGPVDTSVPAPKGGRRQSIWDLPTNRSGSAVQNTSPSVGYTLFNTGREPEKIPGAIPIGKVIGGKFVFIDGSMLSNGDSLHLGESDSIYTRLAATTIPDGASLIGFANGAPWNADSGDAIAGTTVDAVLDEIVARLMAQGASNSGSRRIGAEALTGSASTGNVAMSIVAGSIRQQLNNVLSQAPSGLTPGGLNRRVSENGHRLHGAAPIEKHFADDTSSGGGSAFRVVLNAPTSVIGNVQPNDYADVTLQPIAYDLGGGTTWSATQPIVYGASPAVVKASGLTMAQATGMATLLATGSGVIDPDATEQLFNTMVSIQGSVGGVDGDGFYLVNNFNASSSLFTLKKLDLTNPDFSSTTFTSASITVYNTIIVGSDGAGHRIRSFHYDIGAFAVMGFTSQDAVVLRLYDGNGFALTSGPSMELSPRHAVWGIGRTTSASRPGVPSTPVRSVVRDTSNILNDHDSYLLRGNEYNNPIDASTSHHHGAQYTQYYFLGGLGSALTFHTAAVTNPSFTALPDYLQGLSIPAGFTISALVIEVALLLQTSPSIAAGSIWGCTLVSNPGTSVTGATSTILQIGLTKSSSSSGVDNFNRTVQVTVQCDASGRFMLSLPAHPNLDLSNSLVSSVKPFALLLSPT